MLTPRPGIHTPIRRCLPRDLVSMPRGPYPYRETRYPSVTRRWLPRASVIDPRGSVSLPRAAVSIRGRPARAAFPTPAESHSLVRRGGSRSRSEAPRGSLRNAGRLAERIKRAAFLLEDPLDRVPQVRDRSPEPVRPLRHRTLLAEGSCGHCGCEKESDEKGRREGNDTQASGNHAGFLSGRIEAAAAMAPGECRPLQYRVPLRTILHGRSRPPVPARLPDSRSLAPGFGRHLVSGALSLPVRGRGPSPRPKSSVPAHPARPPGPSGILKGRLDPAAPPTASL